jgi:hypothetical protein
VFRRRCCRRAGLAKELPRAIIGGIADLMSGGIVMEDNSADHGLVLGEMGFLDHVITRVILILGKETKFLFRTQNFGAGKSAVFIELVANLFPHLPILARCCGDGLVIGGIVFINRARAIDVEHDADANIAAILGRCEERYNDEAKQEGDAAHSAGKLKAKLEQG